MLDLLVRCVPHARRIGDSFVALGASSLDGTIDDPADPTVKMFLTSWPPSPHLKSILRGCSREDMAVARRAVP